MRGIYLFEIADVLPYLPKDLKRVSRGFVGSYLDKIYRLVLFSGLIDKTNT